MPKQRILSGIQPTGKLHIGNYLGALRNFVELQNSGEHECFFMVADLHSLTEDFDPKQKRQQILDLVMDYIAIGLDPNKSVIFVQSQLPEHSELTWIFNTLTPLASLERMTQYKDKALRQKSNINVGLFDYPVLQDVDILIYKPAAVPVGEDQVQHLELANDIAKKFNSKFGQTFGLVRTLLTKTPRVMSLLEPTKKMSKSLGDAHVINLLDDAEQIEKKLSRAVTDQGTEKQMSAGTKNLLSLLENFGAPEQHQFYTEQRQNGTIRYAELKKNLAKVIAHHFAPYRAKRKELEKNPDQVLGVIAAGKAKAEAVASATLREVKEKVGLLL